MRRGLRRGVAELICRCLPGLLPARLRSWGWAIRCEVADIGDDTKALLFALDSVRGLAWAVAAHHLHRFFPPTGTRALPAEVWTIMRFRPSILRRPRTIGLLCATGAVMLGLAYLAMAGAPMRYLGINAGALIAGIAMLALGSRAMPETPRLPGAISLAAAIVLGGTALLGDQVEGAARWVQLGALSVQPSLILLPLMILAYARSRDALSTAGIVVAAGALAIQPDRAMASMLAVGLAVVVATRRDRLSGSAFAAAILGLAITLLRADTLPAAPYVDQILYLSFGVHALAGLAVMIGSVLLIVPAVAGRLHDAQDQDLYRVFGAVWLAAVSAAALGNYPTPLVGYGGSAIIGYLLSLTMLPKATRSGARAGHRTRTGTVDRRDPDRRLSIATARTA